jgi:two-component system, cell cycle sensor histidine kinase and response regulator CckA
MDVLLAVAEPKSRRFLERVLAARGHDVTCCASIAEAKAAQRTGSHRLAVVASPLLSGGAFARPRGVRLSPAERRVFVIAVAEGGGCADCEQMLEAGANDVLVRCDEPLVEARLAVAEELVRQAEAAEQAVSALDARARLSEALADLGWSALASADLPALLEAASKTIADALGVEMVKVAERAPDGKELVLRAGIGWKPGLVGSARMSAANGSQSGFALESGEPVVVDDLRKETRFRGAMLLKDHGVVSGVSVLIRGEDAPFGVLGAHTTRLRAFHRDEVSFLRAAANVLGAAVVRAKAADRLRASEERSRQVLENALDAVVAMDSHGRIALWNARAEEVFGWGRAEVLGRLLSDVLVPARDRENHLGGLGRLLATGHGPILDRRLEVAALRKDGREIPVELTVTRVGTNGGSVFYAFLRDQSERVRAEQALRHSERFSRRLVESIPHAAFVFDLRTRRVEYASERAAAVLGWSAADLTAFGPRGLDRIVHAEDRPKVAELLGRWDAAGDEDGVGADLRIRDLSGTWRWIRAYAKVFSRTADGRVRQLVGTCEDVTRLRREEEDRRALEARVRMAQKSESLGILAGGIAHDFNNLLTSVLGNAGLAALYVDEDSMALPFVRQVETAARRAADLTTQLLNYAGKGQLVVTRVDLSRIVEEMTGLLETVVSKDVRVVSRHGPRRAAVEGDPTQLRQVVMNLITNASDACLGRPGEIAVTTGLIDIEAGTAVGVGNEEPLPAGRYTFIEVTDTGCGMDAETLARIFDPFFSTKRTGRGLGLAAVLGIVRGHRGAIRVTSEPGHGSSFQVLIPSCDAPAIDEPVAENEHWRPGGTVLLVDDEEDVRRTAGAMLERLGFEVLEAEDGVAALQAFRRHADRIELVLLDLTMPRLDGARALRRLRAMRPDVRVVVSSGYAADDVRERFARGAPPAGYLHKPYGIEELRAALKAVLSR